MPPELSTEPTEFVVKGRQNGKRLDAYLTARYSDFSRSVIQKVIDAGAVLVNGQPTRASYRVRTEDVISIRLPDIGDGTPTPEDIPLRIAYEDEAFVVVDKDPGIVVHPSKGNWSGTVVNGLQFHFDRLSSVGGRERPGIVHRLDRDTSGLLLVAKDDRVHGRLARQFEERTVKKEYLALVYGSPSRDGDYIQAPIGFHPTIREKMCVAKPEYGGGREAATFCEVIERFDGYAFMRCKPETGRTHQIRVHLAHVGHPVIADKLYSSRSHLTLADLNGSTEAEARMPLIARQALHAHRLTLIHPYTNTPLTLESALPADMSRTIEALRAWRPRTPSDPRSR